MSRFKKFSNFAWRLNGILILLFVTIGVLTSVIGLLVNIGGMVAGSINLPNPLVTTEKKDVEERIDYGHAIILQSSPYIIIPIVKGGERESSLNKSYEGYNGGIINYLFLNKTAEEMKQLFKSEVNIISSNLQNSENQNSELLLDNPLIYHVVTKDTNGDKILTTNDFSAVYISDSKGENLKSVSPEERYVDYFTEDAQKAKLVIGVRDKSGKKQIIIYDYKTGKSINYTFR